VGRPSGRELTGLIFNIQKFSVQDGPDMHSTAELAVRVGAEKVSLLPCHDWAREKYRRLGTHYESAVEIGGTERNGQAVSRWQEILGSHGLAVGVGN
jgi:hypothetical protein